MLRQLIRWIATSFVSLGMLVAVEPVIHVNVEHLAKERHWDEFLANWLPEVPDLSPLLETRWFWFCFGVSVGIALALWVVRLFPERRSGADTTADASLAVSRSPNRDIRAAPVPSDGDADSSQPASPQYAHVLSLVGLDIILDNDNPFIDLSLGVRIKNGWDSPTRYAVERANAEFNGKKEKSDHLLVEEAIIGRGGESLYSYRSISEIPKNIDELVYVRFMFSVKYGPVGQTFRRRWIHILSFSFRPKELGKARYATEIERDEAIVN
jgi:hypothetical protein